MQSILLVDDEPHLRRMVGNLLRAEGFRVREVDSGPAAVVATQDEEPDAVLLDLIMPGETGLETLPRLRSLAPEVPVVMMSGRASLADAVQATRLGAFHFIEKPLTPEGLLVTLRSALELRRTRDLNQALREDLGQQDEMVGRSTAIEMVRGLIGRVAPTDARVLITGESGTGKELAAAAIHRRSARGEQPFVRVNCAAIPRDLVESELFGHEKGSFTGATQRRRGRFELAHRGTLLLDEVGDLHLEAQAKLLRALESGEIERVGGGEPIAVDVRVVAATNKELRAEVSEGRFREDLFFRLHVIPIHLPPLRERREDIPLLVEHFSARNQHRHGLRPARLSPAALDAITAHRWPGNIRELANIMERLAILFAGTEVGPQEVRSVLAGTGPAPAARVTLDPSDRRSLAELLDDWERDLIAAALEQAGGSMAEAARRLQTDRANLYRRMRRLELER